MKPTTNIKSIYFHGGVLGGIGAKKARTEAHNWVKRHSNYETHKVVRLTTTCTLPAVGIVTHRSYEVVIKTVA